MSSSSNMSFKKRKITANTDADIETVAHVESYFTPGRLSTEEWNKELNRLMAPVMKWLEKGRNIWNWSNGSMPKEMMNLIFQYLDLRDLLARTVCVCRSWKQLIYANENSSRRQFFYAYQDIIIGSSIANSSLMTSPTRHHLEDLTIDSQLRRETDGHGQLWGVQEFKLVSTMIYLKCLRGVTFSCRHFTKCIQFPPNLHTLQIDIIDDDWSGSEKVIQIMSQQCPQLTDLTIEFNLTFDQNESRSRMVMKPLLFAPLAPTLTSLSFGGLIKLTCWEDRDGPREEELEFTCDLYSKTLKNLRTFPHLTQLNHPDPDGVNDDVESDDSNN